jgi:heme exporter protein A
VRGLACRRGERLLFGELGFDVPAGAIGWLRGPNGSGKTSLLRILAGLSRPDAGTLEKPADGLGSGRFRPLYIAHANALKEDLSASESLAFLLRLSGMPADPDRCRRALARVGLGQHHAAPVRTLSQGQRRRVALARLAAAPPAPIWLLDEPFDALDGDGIDALNRLLVEHACGGGASVVTSHVSLTIEAPTPVIVDLAAAAAADRACGSVPGADAAPALSPPPSAQASACSNAVRASATTPAFASARPPTSTSMRYGAALR